MVAVAAFSLEGMSAPGAQPLHDSRLPSLPLVTPELIQVVSAQNHMNVSERRADIVLSIRRKARGADPALDDGHFESVLGAIARTPREQFVPPDARQFAYLPTPLKIGFNQTISDAYIVAIMTAQLQLHPDAEVLDVGTGSGYQSAILSHLARHVTSIEIVEPLARKAAKRLKRLGYRNIEVRAGDGFAGEPDRAPFDGIVVAAGAATIPRPLLDQLKTGGRLVMPIGPTSSQEKILILTKEKDGTISRCSLGWTQFVPLTGQGKRQPSRDAASPVPDCYAVDVTWPAM